MDTHWCEQRREQNILLVLGTTYRSVLQLQLLSIVAKLYIHHVLSGDCTFYIYTSRVLMYKNKNKYNHHIS
jgi:hypothetical protein